MPGATPDESRNKALGLPSSSEDVVGAESPIRLKTLREIAGVRGAMSPVAPSAGPRIGFDRVLTQSLTEKALLYLPAPLRDGLTDAAIPALAYCQYEVVPTVTSEGVRYPSVATYQCFAVDDRVTGHTLLMTEIQGLDFPSSWKMGGRSITRLGSGFLPGANFDQQKAAGLPIEPEVRRMMGTNTLRDINENITKALRTFSLEVEALHVALHEVAAALWVLLPEEMRSEWSRVYPMDPIPEHTGVFYRARIMTRGDSKKFGEESFCDKFASFALRDLSPQLDAVGRTIRPVEVEFMESVVEHFRLKQASGHPIHRMV